jgi:flagellar hook protein FlgE
MADNGVVNQGAGLTTIQIPSSTLTGAVASSTMSINANLNSSAAVGDTFSVPVTAYDSLGQSHQLNVTFTNVSQNDWSYNVTIGDTVPTGGTAPTVTLTPASGTTNLQFNSDGSLDLASFGASSIGVQISGLADKANDLSLTWNLANAAGTGDLTQYAQASGTTAVSCDGSAAGQLNSVGINTGGDVVAQFSNGTSQIVAQLAMATVTNPESLSSVGDNAYVVTDKTSTPSIGLPDTGGRGNIIGSALESSTVDLATQFTNLLTFQRGYEAASKVITATDQLAQETIGIIR